MKAPNYKVKTLLRFVKKAKEGLSSIECNLFRPQDVPEVVEILQRTLKISGGLEQTEVLAALVSEYLGQRFLDIRDMLAEHAAGWREEAESGEVFRSWNPLQGPCWALLRVTNVERAVTEKPRFILSFRSFSGRTTGMIWHKVLPRSFVRFMIGAIGGRKFEDHDPMDANGLWLTGNIHLTREQTRVDHIFASGSQLALNRKMLKSRKGPCIGGFHQGTCIDCPNGTDVCPLARHERTFEKGVCICKYPKPHKGYIAKMGLCMACMKAGRFPKSAPRCSNQKESKGNGNGSNADSPGNGSAGIQGTGKAPDGVAEGSGQLPAVRPAEHSDPGPGAL